MKHLHHHLLTSLFTGVLAIGIMPARAAEQASTSSSAEATPGLSVSAAVVAKAPEGVENVLSLSRAQVSEAVIITYIQTSGLVYNLKPSEIVQLHQQGISDRIISVMLEQGHKAPEIVAQPTGETLSQAVPMAVVPVSPVQIAGNGTPLFVPGQNAFEIAAATAQAMSCATPTVASTLHVIPFSSGGGYSPIFTYYRGGPYASCYQPYYSHYGGNGGYRSYGYCAPSTLIRIGGAGRYGHGFHRR